MPSGVHLFRKEELKTSLWSGGGMTELYIYPPGSSFAARDFQLSLVSATIDTEESAFSDFSGYTRLIMSLDNNLELVHDHGTRVSLKQYEPHVFDGRIKTVSRGRVRDFNLIIRTGQGWGESRVIRLAPGASLYPQKIVGPRSQIFEFAYAPYNGYIFMAAEELEVRAGDFLVLDHSRMSFDYRFSNQGTESCALIVGLAALNQLNHYSGN